MSYISFTIFSLKTKNKILRRPLGTLKIKYHLHPMQLINIWKKKIIQNALKTIKKKLKATNIREGFFMHKHSAFQFVCTSKKPIIHKILLLYKMQGRL